MTVLSAQVSNSSSAAGRVSFGGSRRRSRAPQQRARARVTSTNDEVRFYQLDGEPAIARQARHVSQPHCGRRGAKRKSDAGTEADRNPDAHRLRGDLPPRQETVTRREYLERARHAEARATEPQDAFAQV